MTTLQIIGAVAFVITAYFIVLPYLKRGRTMSLFLVEDRDSLFALVLMDIETVMLTKRGAFIIHKYRLKKVNLKSGRVVFNVRYKRVVSGAVEGYARILGCNRQYAYLTSLKKDITVFDLDTGKIIADRTFFFTEKGVDLSDQDWKFDEEKGILLVYDKQGIQYAINGQQITKTNAFKLANISLVINVFDGMQFSDHNHFMMHIRHSVDENNPVGKQLQLKELPGTKRSYLHVSDFFDTAEPDTTNKNSFIKPLLLKLDPNHFLVKHQLTMDDDTKEIFLSKVNLESKEIWKLHKNDLVAQGLRNDRHKFYINRYKGQLILTWINTGAKEFCIASVSEHTGEVLMDPVYFKNKKLD